MVVTKVIQIKNSRNLKLGLNYIDDKEKTKDYILKNSDEYKEVLDDKLKYIIDERKTNFKNYNFEESYDTMFVTDKNGNREIVSSYGLSSIRYAYEEMMMTKMSAKNFIGDRGKKVDVLAHHIIQSFSPEDNLTPEEIHEIGRRTVLELTGGEHEFVIATHLDKNHLHNHIIFNTTNNITLKKFRWKKGTKKSLENISDKHADIFGAKIIERDRIINHTKYEAYRKQDTYRGELRERLRFLLKNSNSFEDFLMKARLLDVFVDYSGKEIKYRLLDSDQERNVRDLTLSKKGYYGLDNIKKMTKANKDVVSVDEIKNKYIDEKNKKEEEFEIRFFIEDWQVTEETQRGLYINVDFGISNKGTIFIPYNKVDKLENGYELFLKRRDCFYFMNTKQAGENRYMKASVVARQLTNNTKERIIYKNYYVGTIDRLIEDFNYLSKNNVTGYDTFVEFQEKLQNRVDKVEMELDRLDSKIAELNKIHSALLMEGTELSKDILTKLKIPNNVKVEDIEKLLDEVRVERTILREKFKEITREYKYTKDIEKNTDIRKRNNEIIR